MSKYLPINLNLNAIEKYAAFEGFFLSKTGKYEKTGMVYCIFQLREDDIFEELFQFYNYND